MSEIANCPLCGSDPYSRWFEGNVEIISCCGHTVDPFDTLASWNQYAAAMELAMAEVKKHSVFMVGSKKEYDDADMDRVNKRMRVLEVFK